MTKAAKITITILSVVTVVAIFVGLYIHVFSGMRFGFGSRYRTVSGTITPEGEISSIDVDTAVGDIRIRTGDGFSVDYNIYEPLVPEVTVNNGVLRVVSGTNNLNFTGINNFPKDLYITITIPEDYEFEDAVFNLDAGNMEIRAIHADELSLDIDAGNIRMDDIKAGRVTADVDAVNFEIDNLTTDRFEVDIDAGNLDIKDSYIDYLRADIDLGNLETHRCTINSGECDVDLGNISLGGDIGSVTTHTSLGSSSND